nr:MAG TPA: major capsid protein [Caudoviricetes sp.]
MDKEYDFGGWATRNNLRCSDGRVILKDAFKDCDGKRVPLVWNHRHTEPEGVLGHAMLENRNEGVYAYCKFNDSERGQATKMLVEHGDVSALSIYANQLKEQGGNVMHGMIREVSLVLVGANPGAFIDSVIAHSDGYTDEDRTQGVIYTGEALDMNPIVHSDGGSSKTDPPKPDTGKDKKDDPKGETVQDVFDTLTEKQKVVVYAMIEAAIKDADDSNDDDDDTKDNSNNKEDSDMKHNVFDTETGHEEGTLCHADQARIIATAKTSGVGSLRAAMEMYSEELGTDLAHADLGFNNISSLFPDYHNTRPGAPELITQENGWVTKVLSKVYKSPFSRIRTRQADMRDITNLRAKGYQKGKQKGLHGNLTLVSRTTDPQTVYTKSKLDRDDIIDITDFDVVAYMYGIDRMNLNEEIATAILVGDGRETGTEGKIDETKIRPIWTDDELYTLHADVDLKGMKTTLQGTNTNANFGENYVYAESIIQTLLYTREKYKGSGTPDFYCTPHLVNVMLLARDLNGRRIYDNVNELKAALNVGEIITVEKFEGLVRTTSDSKKKQLLGIMVNLADYSVGSTKGGELSHFTDFDINFNQQVSLLETRLSGANTRVLSAIALEEDVTPVSDAAGDGHN